MSKFQNPKEEPAVLNTVSSFLKAMSQPPPLGDARKHIIDSGFHFVSSNFHGNLQHTLGQAVSIAEGRKNDGKDEPGEYKLLLADPAPEVYVYDKIAGVWGAIQRVAPDGSVSFRTFATFLLVKLDGSEDDWKISGVAHSHPAEGAPLPPVGKEMTPEVKRLMHFAEELIKAGGMDNLDDWALPGARMVRNGTGASVEDSVKNFAKWAASVSADAKWKEDFEDVTVRTAGDTGLIWMHFATRLSGKPLSSGIDVLVLHRQNGKWFFSATQTFSVPGGQ